RGSDHSGDVFHVRGVAGNESLSLQTGGGDDLVAVGDAANTLDGLAGPLNVQMGPGPINRLVLNDQGHNSLTAYTVNPAGIERTGVPAITYGGAALLDVNTGSNNNTVTVTGTSAATTVHAGAGSVTFFI